jgi:hypothetical protein
VNKLPTITELSSLIRALKPEIGDEYRASGDEDSTTPSMDLTVGWDPEEGGWSYQTGDNSFTGGAYSYPVWAIGTIARRCNSRELARDLIDQLWEGAE